MFISFLPYTTNEKEEIKKTYKLCKLSPIGIPEKPFETKDNALFDPSKLDIYCTEKKKIMTEAVVKMFKK